MDALPITFGYEGQITDKFNRTLNVFRTPTVPTLMILRDNKNDNILKVVHVKVDDLTHDEASEVRKQKDLKPSDAIRPEHLFGTAFAQVVHPNDEAFENSNDNFFT